MVKKICVEHSQKGANLYATPVIQTNSMSFSPQPLLLYFKHNSSTTPGSLITCVESADFAADQSLSQQEEVFILQYFTVINDNYRFQGIPQVDMQICCV